jgi:hypothetical protein
VPKQTIRIVPHCDRTAPQSRIVESLLRRDYHWLAGRVRPSLSATLDAALSVLAFTNLRTHPPTHPPGDARARSHCRFVRPLIHFTPDLLT